ncbi:MAG: lamin tail domain-containing protein, partial [Balneolaceae bacterium]|nr:lamin tail domain-containing protein [Balneolaceae bacterium]
PTGTTDSVAFSLFDSFTPGDLVINEIMYDPPVGLPEYVELYNASAKQFNLRGWQLGDALNLAPISGDTLVLNAQERMVISPDTTALIHTFGPGKYVEMESFPALNNSPGDAVTVRTADGAPVDSLFFSSGWGGDGVALERRATGTESIFKENWASSPHPLGGTPGAPNQVAADTLPPALSGLETIGRQSLLLIFNERIKGPPASDPANYTHSDAIGIEAAHFLEPDSVRLLLDAPLQNATRYDLSYREISDIFGNRIAPALISFIYHEPEEADYGDLFINEFMYDPPAGITEYIELYNSSEKSLDLQEWTLSDNTGSRKRLTHSPRIMAPGSYLVLAPDSTLLRMFPELDLLTMGSRFPSLNNGGDEIVLRRGDGTVLDSLVFESSWGGENSALERRATGVSAAYRENWDNAPEDWGSPGSANTIEPDRSPPDFIHLRAGSPGTLQLIFSERVAGGDIDLSHFTIRPHIEIRSFNVRGDTVELVLERSMRSGTTYWVKARQIDDLFGNRLNSDSLAVDYLVFSEASPGDVVINEIVYRPSPATGPGFVELYNKSGSNFDLSGWRLGDAVDLVALPAPAHLEAGAFLVLTGSRNLAESVGNAIYLPRFASLNDSRDIVYIQNGNGLTIDSLSYDPGWGLRHGNSMERKDPEAASNDPANWNISAKRNAISAGRQNPGYAPDNLPPRVIFSTLTSNGRIEVRFDEFVDPAKGGKFLLGGMELTVDHFDPFRGNTLFLQFPVYGTAGKPLPDLTIHQLADVKGNLSGTTAIPVSLPLKPGDVVINEIMFLPLDRKDDNLPDQGEYVELRNIRDHAVSVEGFFLHDPPDENGTVRSQIPASTVSRWIPANGILLVYADTARTFSGSRIASYFELENNRNIMSVRIEGMGLNLAARNDAVYISDRNGVTVDSVFYDESWHNPNIVDNRGVALERILPDGPSNEPSNWGSSPVPTGGTPGMENRLYRVPGEQPTNNGISFNPNPFSPDGDGFEDHLLINYKLDRPDYLLNVRIFDRYGRMVRDLANGLPADRIGSLIWDGRTDDGSYIRVGIYIVLFKAYDGTTGRNMTFKELAVVARKF